MSSIEADAGTETDAGIVKKMSINMAVIAGVLLTLVYVSFAIGAL